MGGGEVARFLTRQGKDRVNKAVLASSVVPHVAQSDQNPNGVPESTLKDMTEQMKTDRPAFMHSFFKTFFGVGMVSSPVSDQVLMNAWRQAMMAGLRPTLAAAKAFSYTDFTGDLKSFDGVPTLCIHGTADKTVPIDATGRVVADKVPGARLVEYEGSPHGLFETDKDRFCDDLVAFLGGDMSRIDREAEHRSDKRAEEPRLLGTVESCPARGAGEHHQQQGRPGLRSLDIGAAWHRLTRPDRHPADRRLPDRDDQPQARPALHRRPGRRGSLPLPCFPNGPNCRCRAG